MNQSFFRGGTEDRCRHLPRTIVVEAMQSSAPSNGAAPAAVAKKNGDNGHHSKLSGKTKYYHCQLSIKFQISQIHRNLQCTSQFCPSGIFSGFQCSIDKCGKFTSKNKSCLVVAEHGRLALTRRGSHKSALERNCVSVGSRKPPCWLFTVKVNDSLQQSVDVDRLEAVQKIFHQLCAWPEWGHSAKTCSEHTVTNLLPSHGFLSLSAVSV